MKSFQPKYATFTGTYTGIIATVANILALALAFPLINNYIFSSPIDSTTLMSLILFYAIHSFWFVGKQGKVEFDKSTIIFWVLFTIGYTAFGIYMQATPSIIALIAGFSAAFLVNIAIKKIKEYRAS